MKLLRRPKPAEPPAAESRPLRAVGASGTPDRVASAVVRGILTRQYTPGRRLTEAELTAAMNVGRSTAREALRILSARGVVELTPHRGALIRRLSVSECRQLLDVMEVLAGLAARLAARNIGAGDNRTRMEAVAQTLRAPRSGRELASVLDERLDFYNVMFRIAANSEIDRALPLSRAHLFRTQFHPYLSASDLRAMISEYRAVADAILAGDEAKAEQRMRRHIQRTADRTIPRLLEFAPAPDESDDA